jgi:hypothetical protein
MPGSHADDIVGEYFESEDWAAIVDATADPELAAQISPLDPDDRDRRQRGAEHGKDR